MIKTEILDKKSICHALISSTSDPEVIIPIKAVIEDVHFHENIPYYSLRIIKFYDNIDFLRVNFFDKPFVTSYKSQPKPIKIPNKIRNTEELDTWMGDNSKYRFFVESNLVVKTKNEMMELFNKIEEYILCKSLKRAKSIVLRYPYKGPIRMSTKTEWAFRLERAFSDLFPTREEAISFISTI
jgi:hypothetical protein